MMTIGLDLVSIERIASAMSRFGDRFADRILSRQEQQLMSGRQDRAAFLAGRFAAKEAVIKALGGISPTRPSLASVEILPDADGVPAVRLSEETAARLGSRQVLLSISHEKEIAAAVAVIVEVR
jgi:holo-[acyl-carrier protein] synthase